MIKLLRLRKSPKFDKHPGYLVMFDMDKWKPVDCFMEYYHDIVGEGLDDRVDGIIYRDDSGKYVVEEN